MEKFHQGTIGSIFYRGAHGALLVYDVNSIRSIEQLESWREELMSKIEPDENFPIVVCGNKIDLQEIEKIGVIQKSCENIRHIQNICDHDDTSNSIDKTENVFENQDLDVIQWCIDHDYTHVETCAKDGRFVKKNFIFSSFLYWILKYCLLRYKGLLSLQ